MLGLGDESDDPTGKQGSGQMSPTAKRLYEENESFALNLCARFCGKLRRSIHDWEDAQQQARLALCEAAERFDATVGAAFRTFAHSVIRNRLLAMRRSEMRSNRSAVDESLRAHCLSAQAYNSDAAFGDHIDDLESRIASLLPALRPSQRELLVSHYVDGRSIEEIAADRSADVRATAYALRVARERARVSLSLSAQAQ